MLVNDINILYLLASIFLFFLFLEILLRVRNYLNTEKWKLLAFKRDTGRLLGQKKYLAYQSHTYIGYTKAKNCKNPRYPSNSDCFTGSKDIPFRRIGKNTIRIVVIGGSTVAQNDLDREPSFDAELTWPVELENNLNKLDNGNKYEVLNAGCPGYTILESTIHFLTKCIPYKPDYAILYTGINDAWMIQTLPGFKPDYTHARRPPSFPSKKGFLHLLPNIRLSYVYQHTLLNLSRWIEKPQELNEYISCKPSFEMTFEYVSEAVKVYQDYLRSFLGISLIHGIKPVLIPWVYDPDMVSRPSNIISWDKECFLNLLEMNNEVTRKISKEINGVSLLNISSVNPQWFRTGDWVHFSKFGLKEIGNQVADGLMRIQK